MLSEARAMLRHAWEAALPLLNQRVSCKRNVAVVSAVGQDVADSRRILRSRWWRLQAAITGRAQRIPDDWRVHSAAENPLQKGAAATSSCRNAGISLR